MTGNMVTLADGREVDSASSEWQAECLLRHGLVRRVLSEYSLHGRRDQLARIGAAHGATMRQRVEADVQAKWAEAQRAQREAQAARERELQEGRD